MFYILITLSVLFAVGTLIRVLVWNKIKMIYLMMRKPKQERGILEQDPFSEIAREE